MYKVYADMTRAQFGAMSNFLSRMCSGYSFVYRDGVAQFESKFPNYVVFKRLCDAFDLECWGSEVSWEALDRHVKAFAEEFGYNLALEPAAFVKLTKRTGDFFEKSRDLHAKLAIEVRLTESSRKMYQNESLRFCEDLGDGKIRILGKAETEEYWEAILDKTNFKGKTNFLNKYGKLHDHLAAYNATMPNAKAVVVMRPAEQQPNAKNIQT